MPLAAQALLPFGVLLATAALTRLPRLRRFGGHLAAAGTAIAAVSVLVQLIRLAPGARVDLLYLNVFPGADPAIRLDGLSLSFAATLLLTAAALMLVRSRAGGRTDRREPWVGWLFTTTAAVAVTLAGNLLLAYIALQVLTLSWSGALDERSRRVRPLRLSHQIADVGLLLAAASAIHTVGTSAFAGLPSDALGAAGFALAVLPGVARLGSVALGTERPATAVYFEPAIAWAAPAGYLLLRLLSLTGGSPPGLPTQIAAFALAFVVAAGLCWLALGSWSWPRICGRLVAVQASLALALATVPNPTMAVAGTWLFLQLIPLSGLCSIRSTEGTLGRATAALGLTMIPPSTAFPGIWLGLQGLGQARLLPAALPLAIIVVGAFMAARLGLSFPRRVSLDAGLAWAAGTLLVGIFPGPALSTLAMPAAQAVRSISADTFAANLLILEAGRSQFPAAAVGVASMAVLAFVLARFASAMSWRPGRFWLVDRSALRLVRPFPRGWATLEPARIPFWAALCGWVLFGVVAATVTLR